MLDPLTGFAVAGNVLQFADLGIKLISKTCSIYRSTDGLEDEYTYLQTTAQSVRNYNLLLDEFSKDLSIQPGHAAQALLDANNACLDITTEVVSFIEKVAPPNASKRLLGSAKSAFRSLWNQKGCERLERKIANARSNLSMGLLTYMTMQATASQQTLSEAITTSRTQISEQLKVEFTGLHDKVNGAESLTKSLSSMSIRAMKPLDDLQNDSQSPTGGVSSSIKKLNAVLEAEITAATTLREKVKNVDRLFRRGMRNILASLHYPQMDARRDQIRRIHPETMQWVFSRKPDTYLLWHEFVEWLEACDRERIYWIRGKPGSGKSTLMRILEKEIQQHHLGGWMARQQIVRASSYFWHASSSPMQRSMEGLVRSLLYQLLVQLPYLLPEVMTADRWEDLIFAKSVSSRSKLWTIDQLKAALHRVIELTSGQSNSPKNILLQVDGMDELDGTDEDRNEMLELFTTITQESHVKLCLSSRPWTIYTRRLQSSPQLRVEDLNKGDIQVYVHDHLAGDADFREMSLHYPILEDSIRDEITRKASGVFLWVYLVVRDLLKVVRDGGSESLLRRTLSDTPSELNSYFVRMLGSIDPKYRKEASILLQIMLCSLEPMPESTEVTERAGDLSLIHLCHFVEEHLQTFATEGILPRLDPVGEKDLEYILKMLDRRLASRGMGLLEWERAYGDTQPQWYSPIAFFHRTVYDFLLTKPAQQMLHKETNGAFRAYDFRCNLLLSEIDAVKWQAQMTSSPRSPRRIALAKSLRRYPAVYVRPSDDERARQSHLPYVLQLSRTKLLLAQLRKQRLDREKAWQILERLIQYLDPRDTGWQILELTDLDEDSCRIATICRDLQQLDRTAFSVASMEFRDTLLTKPLLNLAKTE